MQTNNKLITSIAQFISVILNPLVIPTLGTLMVFKSGNFFSIWPANVVIWIVFIVSLGTLILPMAILLSLHYLQFISNIHLHERNERIFPYSLLLIPYWATYLLLKRTHLPALVPDIVLAASIALVINIVILFRWKISSHAIGVGGLLSFAFVLFTRWHSTNIGWLSFCILAAGLVSSARLWLNAHTEKQVYAGALIGFLITTVVLSYNG
jgi:membrane-associated phospholipid phosphatase